MLSDVNICPSNVPLPRLVLVLRHKDDGGAGVFDLHDAVQTSDRLNQGPASKP
jgi:hypothetical protein